MSKKQESPALRLVRLVYENGQQATDHSWVRLNGALSGALRVAICGGLHFELSDFTEFYRQLRAGYWIGASPDGFYALACEMGNDSACKAYERHYGFSPYELEGQRVYVGRRFTWDGEHVTCTSMAKDTLIACSYKPSETDCYERKILHRHSITPEQMKAENKRRKSASADKKMAQAQAEAERFASGHRVSAAVLAQPVSALVAKLPEYDQRSVNDVLKRRFKKTDAPTVAEFLTIGHRWRAEHRAVAHSVLLMARA